MVLLAYLRSKEKLQKQLNSCNNLNIKQFHSGKPFKKALEKG